MKGIWGFFQENMRKTIEEREEEDFFFNEVQKKIVDMEITFPGGTSKGRIG